MKINVYNFFGDYIDTNIEQLSLSELCIYNYLDVANRFMFLSGINCDINLVDISADKPASEKLVFPSLLSKELCLFEKPKMVWDCRMDSSKWPDIDIAYMPQIMGKYPEFNDIPKWMQPSKDSLDFRQYSEKVHALPFFLLYNGKHKLRKVSDLLEHNWAVDDIRMLMTFNSFNTYESLNWAEEDLMRCKQFKDIFLNPENIKFGCKGKPDQSPEVLLGGFHKALVESLDNKMYMNPGFPVANNLLQILQKYITPLISSVPDAICKYKEIEAFFNICVFTLFPYEHKKMGLNVPDLFEARSDLIDLYNHTRLIKLPVQVDGKLRGTLSLKFDDAFDKEIVIKEAYRIPKLKKYIGELSNASVYFIEGEIINFFSEKAKGKH